MNKNLSQLQEMVKDRGAWPLRSTRSQRDIHNLATERQQQHLEKQLALGAGIQWTGKKSYCLEKEEELGDGRDGRAEESLATGDGGQVQFHSHWTLMDLPHVQIFESSQLEGSYEGDLLYISCSLFSGVNAE